MPEAPPLIFTYEGEGEFKPSTPWVARRADGHYVIGAKYVLIEHSERSAKSHSHFFAQVREYWMTLPESLADEFPSPEHLRKKALIRKGYCDERSIVCASKAEAMRLAAFMKPMDDYAIIVAREAVVTVYTAKSQKIKAMGAKDFQKSKEDVFAFIDGLLNLPAGASQKHTGRAA